MGQTLDAEHPFLWLVVVPVALSSTAWIDFYSSVALDFNATHMALVFAPLFGVASTLGFALRARAWTATWPLVPFGLAALVYVGSMVNLAQAVSQEPDGAFIPVLPFGTELILPVLALGGGLMSWVLVSLRGRWPRQRFEPERRN